MGTIGAMKSPILSCALSLTLLLGALHAVYADSATWSTNPTNGDWNNPANWTPPTIPNGPGDVATFALSNQTDVSISAVTEVNSITFGPGASAFMITLTPTSELTLSGMGAVNSSAVIQNVAGMTDNSGNASVLRFTGTATAGDSTTIYTNEGARLVNPPGALIQFEENSTAGAAQFINFGSTDLFATGGLIKFTENSTAGNGTFTNTADSQHDGQYSQIEFHDNATAGDGTFTNEVNGIYGLGGIISFFDSTTADHATFTNDAAFASGVWFYDNSTAGNATIVNEGGNYYTSSGITYFLGTSTAGNGLFIANGALWDGEFGNGFVDFYESSKAGNGTFVANGGQVSGADGGAIRVENSATAENGTFYANGATVSGALAAG